MFEYECPTCNIKIRLTNIAIDLYAPDVKCLECGDFMKSKRIYYEGEEKEMIII